MRTAQTLFRTHKSLVSRLYLRPIAGKDTVIGRILRGVCYRPGTNLSLLES